MNTITLNSRVLVEYRCGDCHKLLCKGILNSVGSMLEVKCRGCKKLCTFYGEDASIIKQRSILIRQGLILDTDIN